MKIFDSVWRLINPLKHAKKHGMTVGKNVILSSKFGTSFGSEPYLITLDNYVKMSGGVTFLTHDGGTWPFRDRAEYQIEGKDIATYGSIYIGERTFIGYGATIFPGVKVGKRCVIGAGSVVTHSIPDFSVVAGVPAKIISTLDVYADKCLSRHVSVGYDYEALSANKKEYLMALQKENKLFK